MLTAQADGGLSFILVSIYGLVLIVLLAVNVFILLSSRKSSLLYHFFAVNISLIVWMTALILRISVPDEIWLWLLTNLQYLGICCLSLTLILFGVVYLTGRELSAQVIIPLSLPTALAYLLIVTNPLHAWSFSSITALQETAGPALFLVAGYNYLYIFLGLVFCCVRIIRQLQAKRYQSILFSLSILLPVFLYVLIKAGVLRPPFDLTPLLCTCSVTLLGIAAQRFHFFDITPLARRIIINEISSALAITRPDDRIIDYNLALARLFEPATAVHRLMPVSKLNPLFQLGPDDTFPLRREILLDTPSGQHLFEWTVHLICGRAGRPAGRVYRLAELENEQQLRQLLAGQNEQLEAANQSLQRYAQIASELRSMTVRNRLAREMHDSLGHSLIILISLLERIDTGQSDDPSQEKGLQEAVHLLHQILNQLPLAQISEVKPSPVAGLLPLEEAAWRLAATLETAPAAPAAPAATTPGPLAAQIRNLAQDLALTGIVLDHDLRGPIDHIPSGHHNDLMQICREAITNAVKHGQATTISLFLLAGEQQYDLVILDNGCGSPDFIKGFGLLNMEQRVDSLGGTLRLQSDSSGFGVYVAIPWPGVRSDDASGQTEPVESGP